MFDPEKINEIKRRRALWESDLKRTLKEMLERREKFFTISNIPVNRIYTPEDIADFEYETQLGYLGEYPFTRGVHPTMYRGRLWTMRQYAGFADAEESNRRYKYLLAQGQTGLSIAFDLPTQMGYDSDNALATGEVGKVGVAIDSLKDTETLFNGIPLDRVSTSMTINAPAIMLLAMYISVAKKQNISQEQLAGTTQNDILKEYIARGTYIFPPKPSLKLTIDILEYCSRNMPRWNTISISGYHIREAGATAVQELAFTLANGITYVEAAIERGLDVDKFAPRVAFFFNAHSDFFEEIAKFRAGRRLWAKIMRERFNAKDPNSWKMRFHTQTAGCSLTAQQPENNIVRVTLQALASVLGGTQSLHTNSMDEAFSLPSEKAVKIALRTQQIIAYESGVTNTVDPLGGSYFVEYLTNQIEEEAVRYIEKIDAMGGMITAIEKGWVQKEIAESAYRYQKDVESGDKIVVGVNEFRELEKPSIDILRVNPIIEEKQKNYLRKLREERGNKRVRKVLEDLERVADSDENLMPYVINAVEAYATLGEICDVLRDVFGEYKAPTVL